MSTRVGWDVAGQAFHIRLPVEAIDPVCCCGSTDYVRHRPLLQTELAVQTSYMMTLGNWNGSTDYVSRRPLSATFPEALTYPRLHSMQCS